MSNAIPRMPAWIMLSCRVACLLSALFIIVSNQVEAADQTVQVLTVQADAGQPYGIQPDFQSEIDADPTDKTVRLIILTPRGPLVALAEITFDGEPFRMPREKLVDDLLKNADPDNDGVVTWKEAIANPRVVIGYYQNDAQKEQLIKRWDRNEDGLLDRAEARLLLMQQGGGPVLQIITTPNTTFSEPNLVELLDTNHDHTLSSKELEASAALLKSKDANRNDLIEPNELNDAASGATSMYRFRANNFYQAPYRQASNPVILWNDTPAGQSQIFQLLKTRYAGDKSELTLDKLPSLAADIQALDENQDGMLFAQEIAKFGLLEPHIRLEVAVNSTNEQETGVTMHALREELGNNESINQPLTKSVALEFPGLRMMFDAAESQPIQTVNDQMVQQQLTRMDADKNGYLELDEIAKSSNANFAEQMMSRWDLDQDGKVYPAEIKADYERQMAPRMTQVTLSASEVGPPLFSTLDETGDLRLSLRETGLALKNLLTLDLNQDGELTPNELSSSITLNFSRSIGSYGNFGGAATFVRATNAGNAAGTVNNRTTEDSGPKWFIHMDRNGDGDLNPREFLGTRQKFDEIDQNRDGFIERSEAENVSVPK